MFQIKIGDIKPVADRIQKYPPNVRGQIRVAVGDYLLRVLVREEVPPYKYVSRKTAYPEVGGWFSDAQRRYVMAKMRAGTIKIPYTRRGPSGGIQSKWAVKDVGTDDFTVYNREPGAVYVYDDEKQARQLALVGWKKIGKIIADRARGIAIVIGRAAGKVKA